VLDFGTPNAAPVKVPVKAPVKVPLIAPLKAPVKAPIKPVTAAPVPTTDGNIVHRIDCGSTNQVVVPPNNVVWTPDQYSSSGLSYNTCGTNAASIYCTSRYFRVVDPAPHRYYLPVSANNRAYTVRLHFAEQVRHLVVIL
jgi:Malectin domain